VLAILSSLKAPATIALAAPAAVLTIPILDTTAAILRRKLTGRSIYSTDRGHLHHCLLRRGLSTRGVLLAVSLFCLLTIIGALASLALNNELLALVSAAVVIGILLVSRLFGYAELMLVKERLAGLASSFLRAPPDGHARESEVRLQGTADWKGLWDALTAEAPGLNLVRLRLDVNAPALHEGYHARWDRCGGEAEAPGLWRAELPLTAQGQPVGLVQIAGPQDHEPVWQKIAAVARLVENYTATVASLASASLETPPPPEPDLRAEVPDETTSPGELSIHGTS
jgi:UDP-GlcNAc:undecaprenyl-phosphate GlcNAc-1-phosphate transferase